MVGKDRTFSGDAVNVWGAIAHHASIVGADVPISYVITKNDENIRFLLAVRRQA